VDLEAKIISALSDLKRERRKNKSLKEELIKIKENYQNPNKFFEEVQRILINLKVQLEESRVIEETRKNQLEEKKKINECLEAKIVLQRKELENEEEEVALA
jgi:hypothetical protein